MLNLKHFEPLESKHEESSKQTNRTYAPTWKPLPDLSRDGQISNETSSIEQSKNRRKQDKIKASKHKPPTKPRQNKPKDVKNINLHPFLRDSITADNTDLKLEFQVT